MAQSYIRRINLYINGQQVTNDIASIRAEMNKTINTQAQMTIGSYPPQQMRLFSVHGLIHLYVAKNMSYG